MAHQQHQNQNQQSEVDRLLGELYKVEREIERLRPIAKDTSYSKRWGGLKTWQWRDQLQHLEETRHEITTALDAAGYVAPPQVDPVFEFDVVEERAGRLQQIVHIHAHQIQGCRHLATGKDRFQAERQAILDHKTNCMKS